MSHVDYNTLLKAQLVELIGERDELLDRANRLIDKVSSIAMNKNQTPADRIQSVCLVIGHPEEVLSGQSFVLDVEEERKRSGVSNKTAATFFNAMREAGGIEYTANQIKKVVNGEVRYTTESTIAFKDNFDVVNTRATTTKEKIREEEKVRVEARMQKLATPVCPSCHSDQHISFAPVPVCMKCEVQMEASEIIPSAELVRMVEEQEAQQVVETPKSLGCKQCGLTPEEANRTVTFDNGVCSTCSEIALMKGAVA